MSGATSLAEILRAYAAGDSEAQQGLLEEFEPLLFGYLRSLAPTDESGPERAARTAHELLLAFHLRARNGELALETASHLRRLAHHMASARGVGEPFLAFFGDEERWTASGHVARFAERLDSILGSAAGGEVAAWLEGSGAPPPDLARRLRDQGLLE